MKKQAIETSSNTQRNPVDNPPAVISVRISLNEVHGQSPNRIFGIIDRAIYKLLLERGVDANLTCELLVEDE